MPKLALGRPGPHRPQSAAILSRLGAGLIFRKAREIIWCVLTKLQKIEAMIIDFLRREHGNIAKLLLILEREVNVFDRAEQPNYELISAVISYFEGYPDAYHHPQGDTVFRKLKARDPAAAANIGDLAADHRRVAERLRRVRQAVESVLTDREVPRHTVDQIIREFIAQERRHMAMEERDFFPAAEKALQPEDWAEIASTLTAQKDPLFSEAAEERFDALRKQILQLGEEAEAERG